MKQFLRIPYPLLALAASAVAFTGYLSVNTINSTGSGGFIELLEETSNRPYIYRVLVPNLAKAGAQILPQGFVDLLKHLPQQSIWAGALHNLSGGMYYGEAFCAFLLMYLSLTGFMLVERALLRDLGYAPALQYAIPPLMAILCLPFSVYFAYVYDLPQMFLFAACALLLFQKKWDLYLALLAVTTLNKETAFLLIIVYALYYFPKLTGRLYFVLLSAQLFIFLSLRAIISNVYRNNPGYTIYFSLKDHIEQYRAYPPIFIFTLFFFGCMVFLLFKNWHHKPLFLRYASIPFFLVIVLFFVGGMPMEFRIFLDVYPAFGILLFPHHAGMTPIVK